jgi:hypothetical protein
MIDLYHEGFMIGEAMARVVPGDREWEKKDEHRHGTRAVTEGRADSDKVQGAGTVDGVPTEWTRRSARN